MSATIPCIPCCAETQVTNVPGVQGDDGNDGTNGVNAYTLTTVPFTVPDAGSNVTVPVENSSWMVEGQFIVIEGPATFKVVSIPNATSVTLEFQGASGDVAPGTNIPAGAGVSPAGAPGVLNNLKVYAAGTNPALTTTPQLLDFGTTDPSLTISSPGTWLIFSYVRYDYVGATFAASELATTKLRRTNNTAADITNASAAWRTQIITTESFTAHLQHLPPIIYTTANNDDIIELWASITVTPSAGTVTAREAAIVAIKIA